MRAGLFFSLVATIFILLGCSDNRQIAIYEELKNTIIEPDTLTLVVSKAVNNGGVQIYRNEKMDRDKLLQETDSMNTKINDYALLAKEQSKKFIDNPILFQITLSSITQIVGNFEYDGKVNSWGYCFRDVDGEKWVIVEVSSKGIVQVYNIKQPKHKSKLKGNEWLEIEMSNLSDIKNKSIGYLGRNSNDRLFLIRTENGLHWIFSHIQGYKRTYYNEITRTLGYAEPNYTYDVTNATTLKWGIKDESMFQRIDYALSWVLPPTEIK